MSKRKNQLAGKLNTSRPGWQSVIQPTSQVEQDDDEVEEEEVVRPKPRKVKMKKKKTNQLHRKTYLLTNDLIERINGLAEEEAVGINDLVRFLLGTALDFVDDGQIEIPTAEGKRKII